MTFCAEPSISSVVILDDRGQRIAARYYTERLQTLASQQKFEGLLHKKATKSAASGEADIVLFDGHVAVMRQGKDTNFIVTGTMDENEIILVEVLGTLFNALTSLMPGGSLDSTTMLEKLDVVLLVLDELVDGGVILEIEPAAIVSRVGMKGTEGASGASSMLPSVGGTASTTPQQALLSFKEQMTRAFKATGT
jgi:hypothetical protein